MGSSPAVFQEPLKARIKGEGPADTEGYQPNRPLFGSSPWFGRGLPGSKWTGLLAKGLGAPGFALVSIYQAPRLNIFNQTSVTGATPFAARAKEAATV